MLFRVLIVSLVLSQSWSFVALADDVQSNSDSSSSSTITVTSVESNSTLSTTLAPKVAVETSSLDTTTETPDVVKVHLTDHHGTNHSTSVAPNNHTAPLHKIDIVVPIHHDNKTTSLVNSTHHVEPEHRFSEYIKPICEALDKLSPRQVFRVQSQLKQFVQLTNGKLAICFMKTYGMNPTLKLVSKEDIRNICLSCEHYRHSIGDPSVDHPVSIKSFLSCAKNNWDEALDKEMDRICAIRSSNLKKHAHLHNKNSTGTNQTSNNNVDDHSDSHHTSILHDDEDGEGVAIVNDVMSKVLDDGKNSTEVKFIDAASSASTVKPSMESSGATKAPTGNHTSMDDPNTVLVLVDDTAKTTTVAPKKTIVKVDLEKPNNGSKTITVSNNSSIVVTTVKPVQSSNDTKITIKTVSVTEKPIKLVTTFAPHTTEKPTNKTAVVDPTLAPLKALETLESVLERQDKEKRLMEAKFKLEREKVMKDFQKKQDDSEAQSAIKSLQVQRQTVVSANKIPDTRLHQMEHERQMMIDPIGHTLKHQEYEMKQRAKLGRR